MVNLQELLSNEGNTCLHSEEKCICASPVCSKGFFVLVNLVLLRRRRGAHSLLVSPRTCPAAPSPTAPVALSLTSDPPPEGSLKSKSVTLSCCPSPSLHYSLAACLPPQKPLQLPGPPGELPVEPPGGRPPAGSARRPRSTMWCSGSGWLTSGRTANRRGP